MSVTGDPFGVTCHRDPFGVTCHHAIDVCNNMCKNMCNNMWLLMLSANGLLCFPSLSVTGDPFGVTCHRDPFGVTCHHAIDVCNNMCKNMCNNMWLLMLSANGLLCFPSLSVTGDPFGVTCHR